MSKDLQHIINLLRSEGKDYTHFKSLLEAIKAYGLEISKDEILEFVANDSRIQLHTTPNSIAKLISHLAKKRKPQSAIDICCGTGNILYYLQNEIDDLTGVEIIENVAELTKYFIPDLHIITADSFKYPFSQKYDLVVGNIPYGMRIETEGKRIPAEEAFLRKAHELLTINGTAIMLVPYSVLFSGQFQNFRNDFAGYLQEIIALPSGSVRNTNIKTALLVFGTKESSDVKLMQLQKFDRIDKEYQNTNPVSYPKEKLIKRWDPEFHLTKENSFYKELENFQTKELQELAEIIKGKMIPSDTLREQGDYLYLKPVHIQKEGLNVGSALKYVSKKALSDRDYNYILQSGDIVISTIFNDLKMFVYQMGDIPAFASNNLAIIRSSKQDYILSYLQTGEGKRIFKTQAEALRKGLTIPHITLKDLLSIRIPILPISDLNSLGNKSIQKSTKNELLNQLALLKSFKSESPNMVNEPMTIYGESSLLQQTDIILNFLNDRFNRVESQLNIVSKKLDKLLELVKELKKDFDTIKALPRDDEEKLFKLCQKIDNKLDVIYEEEKNTIEGYIEEIKRWLDLWELLDIQSQKYLPIAEFIFDELNKIPDPDYAPFVLEYCRTLENEILKKLFESYHAEGLKDIDRISLVKNDLENQNTGIFAKMVGKNDSRYELGKMTRIMSYLKEGGRTLESSKLLQHFRAFTIAYFDTKIIEAGFLKDIENLTTNYRNKAAHPYSIGIDMAKQCQELLRKSLNVFLESIKINKEYEK
jgi:SAM-dependent methyltransferase